uniref:Bromodomain adjacent to zinc finger domain, 2Ba n=1 Tax=Pundamilia nyererei TaxID=303518 RepID=A0A3B4ERY6_9CICH
MESGERLVSPAPTLSASSLAPSPSALGSTLSASGRLFGAAGEQPFIGSTLSSAFPLVNHPAFGALYTAGAGRPEFGGLGSLGMSAALAAHPQLGALSEWWRAAEAHGRGAAAFLPSFIGFPPFFAPHIQSNHSASPVPIRMPGKNSHAAPKGTALSWELIFIAQSSPYPSHNHYLCIFLHNLNPLSDFYNVLFFFSIQKPRKKTADTSVVSNSESGTSSDSSSDGSLSSDLEDLAEDDEDDDDEDEDDEEEDKHSELSDTEKRTKKKTKATAPSAQKVPSNPPTLVPLPCSVSPPALSQTSPLALHSSRSRTEGPQQHFSVIQSTGLAANSKPLALLTQPRRESSPSSSPIALTTSPKAPSSTASPKPPKLLPSNSPPHLPLSLCSSPKPLSVPSPPRSTLPMPTSPKPFGLTSSLTSSQKSSLKPPKHSVSGTAKSNKRKLLEASLAQINEFRLRQVSLPDNIS